MASQSSVLTLLVWRIHHRNGRLCPRGRDKSRVAWMVNRGDRLAAHIPCGCDPDPGCYLQADDPYVPTAVDVTSPFK